MREYDYIYRACARTLENIKRTCRERKQKDAATLLSKKETKGRSDRRRNRRKGRVNARLNVTKRHSQLQTKASLDMVTYDCVEGDETEFEDLESNSDDDEPRPAKKYLRVIIPEWWSDQNYQLQEQLDSRVPQTPSGYPAKQPSFLTR
ncbi:unnamed protein product, partial [Tilletia caries]